jgi:hypothetical protein
MRRYHGGWPVIGDLAENSITLSMSSGLSLVCSR